MDLFICSIVNCLFPTIEPGCSQLFMMEKSYLCQGSKIVQSTLVSLSFTLHPSQCFFILVLFTLLPPCYALVNYCHYSQCLEVEFKYTEMPKHYVTHTHDNMTEQSSISVESCTTFLSGLTLPLLSQGRLPL